MKNGFTRHTGRQPAQKIAGNNMRLQLSNRVASPYPVNGIDKPPGTAAFQAALPEVVPGLRTGHEQARSTNDDTKDPANARLALLYKHHSRSIEAL